MSSKYHCPRCEFDHDFHKAPLGKVRNQRYNEPLATAAFGSVEKWIDCKACNGTGFIPDAVIEGIKRSFPNVTEMTLSTLKWDMDHFYFIRLGLYCGVELDGHCHS